MHPENEAILKSLVAVAWADGKFEDAEKKLLEGLLEAFSATEAQQKALYEYASQKRGLEDVPLEDLSPDDLRVLIQHAVLLTYIDGTEDEAERSFVQKLASYVGIPDVEAKSLIASAEARAKGHLHLLK